jgi:hypothetical protein
MPRLVIKTKKKRPPGGEQADSKSSCAASPSSSHRAIVSSLKPSIILQAISDGFSMIAATGTNFQSVMDAIAKNVAELCDQSPPWCGGSTARQARHCTLGIDPMQVQEQDDEIDRAFTLAAP